MRNCPGCGRQVAAPPEADHEHPPFTRDQLDEAGAAFAQISKKLLGISACGVGAFFALFIGVVIYDVFISAEPDLEKKRGWWLIGGMSAIAVLTSLPFLWILSRAERAALKCPSCSASSQRTSRIIRVTGNCGTCGRRMIPLPPPASEPPLLTVAEYRAAQARIGGADRHQLVLGLLIVGMIAVIHLPFCVLALANHGDPWDVFEPQYGLKGSIAIVFSVLAAWSVVIGWLLIRLMRASDRRFALRRSADPALRCPHCQEGLGGAPAWVVASRRCPACCNVVLAEP